MKVAKEFKWEMGHRLSFHQGKCKNLHGHSYKLLVELGGDVNKDGIVIDYYDIKNIVAPLIEKLDHSFMVYTGDHELVSSLSNIKTKLNVVDFESTAENICKYLIDEISKSELPSNIKFIRAVVYEQDDTYAECELSL